MDQKEKAQELLDLFNGNTDHAVKCVNEIIKEVNDEIDGPNDVFLFIYWKNVKKELKKL